MTLKDVPPGDYLVQWGSLMVEIPGTNGSFPAYIESMRAGGQDILQNGLHVDASFDQPIRITIRNNFGSISGRVTGCAFSFPGTNVVLVPDFRNDLARFKMNAADSTGEFRFKDVAPGDYKIYVRRSSDFTDVEDPDFQAAHEASSRAIKVQAGGETTVDVPFVIGDPKP